MKLNPNFTFILNVFIQNVHNVYKRKGVKEQIRQFADGPVRATDKRWIHPLLRFIQ